MDCTLTCTKRCCSILISKRYYVLLRMHKLIRSMSIRDRWWLAFLRLEQCTSPKIHLNLNLCVKRARRAERLAATPWKEPHGSAPWRKFRIGRAVDVASEFLWWLWPEVRRRINVGLSTNDHTDVRVQVNSAWLAGHESKMNEVA